MLYELMVEPPAPAAPVQSDALYEKLRILLSQMAVSGKKNKVKALLRSFGAACLSDLDPACYAELLTKAEEI